uniref:30S ribosomal protein S14 n=1 Tax=Jaagichlorella roystonensis TaxID=1052852 RepID=A0A6C0M9K6_9CHLO|nr:30S ribosomal protein S14 [Jaagichlorella roystonensis]QHU78340.1 30S ribosomal protein S14 [Jaagichlorella roystonensis]
MFNSIRKDDSCRKLVKSFEILRLQNKIFVEAMSISDPFFMLVEKRHPDVALFDNGDTKNKVPSLLPSISSKQTTLKIPNEDSPEFSFVESGSKTICQKTTASEKMSGDNKNGNDVKKMGPTSNIGTNIDKNNKTFYNHNRFVDLDLYKSSIHLFAKKKVKAELQNKALTKNTLINVKKSTKIRGNNQKFATYYNAFLSSLLTLAKGRIKSLPRNSSKSRIKNRCIETGRAHSVLSFCKLSRIRLRENASKGLISGISKASW